MFASGHTMRVGIGYDSHRCTPGGPMRLGGVDIPSDVSLTGHSDADAVLHAITDGLLGACGLGDIGEMFPDTAEENRGKDSAEMLAAAVERSLSAGWRVSNVDVTIVAQAPKIGPHRQQMRSRIAQLLSVGDGDVSVKGKTNERMGFVGREEGLAVMCVVAVVRA